MKNTTDSFYKCKGKRRKQGRMMKRGLLCLLVFMGIFSFSIANAGIRTITATQSYKMNDNDSRNEVRRICSIEAVKAALDQAAAYIGTLNTVKHYRLSQQEIKAYTSAALEVKTANQNWLDMVVTTTAVTDVDADYVEKLISRIKSDAFLQKEFNEQQQKREELEQALAVLSNKLKPASLIKAEDFRKERNAVIREIGAIEAKRMEIIKEIIKKSLDAKKRITVKMTMKNVKSLLGESDARTYENFSPHGGKTYYVWYYGYTRIYFDDRMVAAIQ